MKSLKSNDQGCLGFVVPEQYSVGRLSALFRRANTIDSLDLMYERRTRDIKKEEMDGAHINACLIDAYRAYLVRIDEIEAGKYVGRKAITEQAVAATAPVVKPKAKPRRSKPTLKIELPTPPVPASRPTFSDAESALKAELSRLSF